MRLDWKIPRVEMGIILLAAALRLILLDLRPLHHDEGVNGWFVDQITQTGRFHYDPTNYHGPLHFYTAFLSQTLFGREPWALRLPAALASLLSVWAMLRFREFFGTAAARMAALAMAVSPAFVFYGRYSIHESWMPFFGLMLVHGLFGLWEKGGRKALFTLIFGATGMILTKETYAIHFIAFLLAGIVLWLWQKAIPSHPPLTLPQRQWTWKDLAAGLCAGAFVIVFFYSGTFFDFPALKGLYQTFTAWFTTGVGTPVHTQPKYQLFGNPHLSFYWPALMARYEWPALAGLAACVRYAFPSDTRLRYLAIYGSGTLLAYTLIPYKTPWCIISILWPFFLIFGAVLAEAMPWARNRQSIVTRRFPAILATGLLIVSFASTIRLNFFHCANPAEPYVYVHTLPEEKNFTGPLLGMAERDHRYFHIHGLILLKDQFPLPWELGEFTRVGYYGSKDPWPDSLDAGFIAAPLTEASRVEKALVGTYYKRSFRLRTETEPAVAYFNAPLFKQWFGAEPEINNPK